MVHNVIAVKAAARVFRSWLLDVEIFLNAKTDEFWSYVGNKANQRWTWYAID
jgi:hypothetical protein